MEYDQNPTINTEQFPERIGKEERTAYNLENLPSLRKGETELSKKAPVKHLLGEWGTGGGVVFRSYE